MAFADKLMLAWKIPRRWTPTAVFALGVILLLPSIWSEASVTGMDEYWLSLRTPMEMLDRGDWLTPWVNGKERLQKPPLVYWAILLNYKLFGINLVSARIWGGLAGAGLAMCACLLSRELFGRDGLLAGLLALATMGVAVEGRRAMLDLPAALFSTLAVLCFLKWWRTTRYPESEPQVESPSVVSCQDRNVSRIAWIVASAFLLGLSFMTKGPVGFLFFGTGVIACLTFLRTNQRPSAWHVVPALAVLAAVCLPWPLAMRHLWSDSLSRTMGEELAARQFGHWTPGSPLSAWSGALGLVLPWTPLMLAALFTGFFRAGWSGSAQTRFLIGWFVLAAVPFFFMRSFERYMLALVPAQIVLCAQWLEANKSRSREVVMRICIAILVLVALTLCAFALWFRLATWEVLVLILLAGLAAFLVLKSVHSHWTALCSATLFTVALGGIYPRLGINALPNRFSADLGGSKVTQFDPPQPSLLSMRVGRSVQAFSAEDALLSPQIVFVDGARRDVFFALLGKRQLDADEKGRFRTFYSRRAWIRFARPGATWEDWKAAIQSRSLEGLKAEFYYYRVAAKRA